MKLLTLNFLTCAIKTCKSSPLSFPLHPREVELEILETDYNAVFLRNILPRLEWEALRVLAGELGLPSLPESSPDVSSLSTSSEEDDSETPTQVAQDLHRLLLETCIKEGKLVCGCCGHEYAVKEGVANFLLPGHLV
ncbi:Trm112p-domain-containing protein [Amniculicola lignicola CBS 123094]|uniref:Trm112p-domain-containing protein n=1 Tax=Amniculicola lignicola CBS 123094 TaxID=1392246 RepID=A0A6A5WRB1_9PLEO|nr:Trm112p-domain-containing protein [Amniculicola lignicola CBS 123094]